MYINPPNDSIQLFYTNKTGLYGLIVFDNNDIIYLIQFNPELAFNLQAMDFDKFVYEFCINYKIPFDKINKSDSFYQYNNYDEGYLIAFATTNITLSYLQKPSELHFK